MPNDLYLKPEKCFFKRDEVEFLELIVKNGHVSMDPTKDNSFTKWPTPTTYVKETQSFIGFANFYCQFIFKFLDIAKPMMPSLGRRSNGNE